MTATHPACGKSWTGTRREHCAACCETFNSQSAGDMHRVGDWAVDTVNPRRCMSVEEMRARGMFFRDGLWFGEADSRRGREDLSPSLPSGGSEVGPDLSDAPARVGGAR